MPHYPETTLNPQRFTRSHLAPLLVQIKKIETQPELKRKFLGID
jgi:hypothetical protein